MTHPLRSRLAAAAVVVGSLAPLIVASRLTPDPTGTGTHRQLGLQPCTVLRFSGYPCPTCGITTSLAYAVRGSWRHALCAQPMGAVLAAGLMIAAAAAAHAALTGRRWVINWYRVSPIRVVIALALLFVAAWGYKIVTVMTSFAPTVEQTP